MATEQPVQRANFNPRPKARFQLTANNMREHRAMMEKPEFDRGLDVAMLEYQRLLAEQNTDGNSAMAAGFRAQGALELVAIFKTLAETVAMPTPRRDPDNLPNLENLKRGN